MKTAVLLAVLSAVATVASVVFAAPGDLVLPRKEGSLGTDVTPASVFPHWIHRVQFRCDACHDRLFEMELGATDITMDQMNAGGSCATCHNGEVAFSVDFKSCNTCHRVPDTGTNAD